MKNLSLITATMILPLAAAVMAGPQLSIPESEFHFGKVPQSCTISHTFWLYSVGDDTLRITKIIPGCGCTKAPVEDSVLAPGDSTRLDILFDTGRYGGYVTKKPYIETNMGEEKIMLAIHTHILNSPDSAWPLTLNPNYLDVSQFSEAPRRKAVFSIQNPSRYDFKLTLLDYPVDYFTVKLPAEVKAGQTVQGEIEVTEGKITEEFKRSLTFKISDETETRYTLPVKRMYRIKGQASAGK